MLIAISLRDGHRRKENPGGGGGPKSAASGWLEGLNTKVEKLLHPYFRLRAIIN